MRTFVQPEPLTHDELDLLGEFLESSKGGRAMNFEQLDGFFAARIAGPETVMPSKYYSEVFGDEMSEACEFAIRVLSKIEVSVTNGIWMLLRFRYDA
jgi:yecA family protein